MARESWFDSQQGYDISLFSKASRLAFGPTQPPILRVPGALSLLCDADHPLYLVLRLSTIGALHLHLHTFCGMHKDNFTFLWIVFLLVSGLFSCSWITSVVSHRIWLSSFHEHSTILDLAISSISMSCFCSLIQVMLMNILPHSQGCCVIQELSLFGPVFVKYDAVFFWHPRDVWYHHCATCNLFVEFIPFLAIKSFINSEGHPSFVSPLLLLVYSSVDNMTFTPFFSHYSIRRYSNSHKNIAYTWKFINKTLKSQKCYKLIWETQMVQQQYHTSCGTRKFHNMRYILGLQTRLK